MMYRLQSRFRPQLFRLLRSSCVMLMAGLLNFGLFGNSPIQAQMGTGSIDLVGETVHNAVYSWEWNTDDDFEGWTSGNINNAAVVGGALTGESLGDGSFPAGADPTFSSPAGLGFVIGSGTGQVDRVQFSAQFDVGVPTSRTEMFMFPTEGAHGSQGWIPADFPSMTDGNIHIYTLDFDGTSPLWGQTINTVRLDPVADNQNVADSFAFDFLRLGSQTPVVHTLGDVNGDGIVDEVDFGLIRDNFFGTQVGRSNGDLNEDGLVNLKDFGEWSDNFPFPSEPFLRLLVGAVPEPGSALLALIGAAFLGTVRRRQHPCL